MGRLDGKVAIITGGASGLGEATARLFAQEGAAVALGDIHEQRGAEVVKRIEADGGKAVFQITDVRNADHIKSLVDAAEATFGHVHIMVANAGIGGAASRKQLEDVTEDEFDEVMQVNAAGLWRSFKYAAPAIRRAGGGAMTSSASIAGLSTLGGAKLGAYSASKHAAVSLTKHFAAELADDNIRVNCVCPGRMLTNIDESYGYDERALQNARNTRATGKIEGARRVICEPIEVAYLHLFLCSDEASFVNGQAIMADGGGELFLNRAGTVTPPTKQQR
jgi:NAD(P)-dependent dehydrogenase (short-subunit alcohol dehydrogenase family)